MMLLDNQDDDGAAAPTGLKKKLSPLQGATDVNGTTPSPTLNIPPIDVPSPIVDTPAPTATETGFTGSNAPAADNAQTPPAVNAPSEPFSVGKAQGGEGPASVNTPTDPTSIAPSQPTLPSGPELKNDGSPFNITPPNALDTQPIAKPISPIVPVSDVPPIEIPPIGEVATETPAMSGSNAPVGMPAGQSPIDPANDLRSQVVLPGDDPAQQAALDATTKATTALDSFDRRKAVEDLMNAKDAGGPDVPDLSETDVTAGADPSLKGSDRLNNYGSMLDDSVKGLNQVDRVKMAQELYDIFDKSQAPQDAANERRAKQIAAATGGLRSGRLRTAIGDLELAKDNARSLEKRKLIADALSGSIDDQYRKAGFLSGTENDLANREAGLRGEQRTDRGYKTAIDTGNVERGISTKLAVGDRKRSNFESNRSNANAQADAASGDIARRVDANRALFGDISNQGRSNRNEVRGERDYENQLEGDAFNRRLAQYKAEQDAKNTDFSHGLQTLNAGEAGNPSDVLAQLARSGNFDPAMLAELARTMGQGGGATTGSGGGGAVPTTGTGGGAPPISDDIMKAIIDSMRSNVHPSSNIPS